MYYYLYNVPNYYSRRTRVVVIFKAELPKVGVFFALNFLPRPRGQKSHYKIENTVFPHSFLNLEIVAN
jgi:hypothetical protein